MSKVNQDELLRLMKVEEEKEKQRQLIEKQKTYTEKTLDQILAVLNDTRREMLDELVGDLHADFGGEEATILQLDVTAILDLGDDGGVGAGGFSFCGLRDLEEGTGNGDLAVADASDFSAANQGQLKNMTVAAYEYLLGKIPAGLAGSGDPGGLGRDRNDAEIVPQPLHQGPRDRDTPLQGVNCRSLAELVRDHREHLRRLQWGTIPRCHRRDE